MAPCPRRLVGVWALTVLLLLMMLTGCGRRQPDLPPLAQGDVILAFGDSLTYGTGASAEQSYPAQLEALIGRTVINAGVPGETTVEGLNRLTGELDTYHPKLMLLCLGGNDMLRGMDTARAANNLRAMVRQAQRRGVAVLLIGVPQPNLLAGTPKFYANIAGEFALPYEGEVFNRVLKTPGLKGDPIHPNGEGYRQVAESLAALLKETGAVE